MYAESVVIEHEAKRQTLRAAVFTDNTGDSLVDDTLDTDREDIQLVFDRRDWGYVSKLQRGDVVIRTSSNGMRYKIAEVKYDHLMGWCILARSV